MAQTTYKLVFMTGERAGEQIALPPGERVILGRSKKGANQVVNDALVSREHLELEVTDEGVMVRDLNSTHGTFLNGNRLRGAVSLAHDDVLALGEAKLRFVADAGVSVAPAGAEDQETAYAGPGSLPASVAAGPLTEATRFAGADERDETRFAPLAAPAPAAEEEGEHTRVIGQDATRFLDAKELGAKPGAAPVKPGRSPVLGVVAIVVVLLVVLGLFAALRGGGAKGAREFHDEALGVRLEVPAAWRSARGPEGALVAFAARAGKGQARITVTARKAAEYALTGLTVGFKAYAAERGQRDQGFEVARQSPMTVNGVRLIFFTYRGKGTMGKGVLTFNGDTRFVLETECPPDAWDEFKSVFTGVLESFDIDGSQQVLDYPGATKDMRRLALSDPEALRQSALSYLRLADDLVKRKDVRPDNLHRATESLRTCLQEASAFTTPPDFCKPAAEKLLYAQKLFDEAVRAKRFAIMRAEKNGDLGEAYWLAHEMMQMVPDKLHPAHQYAYKLTKKYAEASSRR